SGATIAKNGSAAGSATISYADTNYSSRSITLNGKAVAWPSANKVTTKGTYVVTVTDKAGNKSTFTFKVA
ncbi:MAG: hypothetical protein P4M02_01755, partial [Clostridia bacterium]|nr:hypothetical protein [Clostridia bacterium]